MKSMHVFFLATALTLGAGVAQAQEAAPEATAPQAAAPAPEAQPEAAAATFSDAEVHQFVTAAMTIQKIEKDTSLTPADMQPKMAAAVQESGLSAERFNAIAKASAADPALMKRIQLAAADVQKQAAPAAAPAAAQ